MMTPTPGQLGSMTPEQMQSWRWEKEMDDRNRPLSDDELDALFPQEGYKVCGGVLNPGSQYDNARACVVFVASVVLGNTQLDQGSI